MKQINIEVEVGDGYLFNIVKEIKGFWISYDSKSFSGWKPPEDSFNWIIDKIKEVMKDLNIQAPHFALHLVLEGLATLGNNPRCLVNKQKDIIYLRLPIDIINGQFGVTEWEPDFFNKLLYHELMHAKDCLEDRFPTAGLYDPTVDLELTLISSLLHFSIEGRLEKNGKPYRKRENAIEAEYEFAMMFAKIGDKNFLTKEFFQKACDELWGKEVTFKELKLFLKEDLGEVRNFK